MSLKPGGVVLDNDQSDRATELFFSAQGGRPTKYRRSYFGDCYGIIDGVSLGLGRAVMPKHLVESNRKIKIAKGSKPFNVDVVLHHYQQPIYSKLHEAVVSTLTKNASALL